MDAINPMWRDSKKIYFVCILNLESDSLDFYCNDDYAEGLEGFSNLVLSNTLSRDVRYVVHGDLQEVFYFMDSSSENVFGLVSQLKYPSQAAFDAIEELCSMYQQESTTNNPIISQDRSFISTADEVSRVLEIKRSVMKTIYDRYYSVPVNWKSDVLATATNTAAGLGGGGEGSLSSSVNNNLHSCDYEVIESNMRPETQLLFNNCKDLEFGIVYDPGSAFPSIIMGYMPVSEETRYRGENCLRKCFSIVTKPKTQKNLCLLLFFNLIIVIICWFVVPFSTPECRHIYSDKNRIIYHDAEVWTNHTINVAIIGDSLVANACSNFNLIGRLHSQLPSSSYPQIRYKCIADGGWRLAKIRQEIVDVLAAVPRPQGVIMYGDSDVSDVNEDFMTLDEVMATRNDYVSNLRRFIEYIQNTSSTSIIGIGGPVILGEGSFGLPIQWWGKSKMLEDYHAIKKDIVTSYNVQYIDIRQLFLDALATATSNTLLYCGYLTFDGEHENARGTSIIATALADAIKRWLLTTNIHQ